MTFSSRIARRIGRVFTVTRHFWDWGCFIQWRLYRFRGGAIGIGNFWKPKGNISSYLHLFARPGSHRERYHKILVPEINALRWTLPHARMCKQLLSYMYPNPSCLRPVLARLGAARRTTKNVLRVLPRSRRGLLMTDWLV